MLMCMGSGVAAMYNALAILSMTDVACLACMQKRVHEQCWVCMVCMVCDGI